MMALGADADVADELDALEAIYGDDLVIGQATVALSVPEHAVTLTFTLPTNYPVEAPSIAITSSNPELAARAQSVAYNKAATMTGSPMLFEVAEVTRDFFAAAAATATAAVLASATSAQCSTDPPAVDTEENAPAAALQPSSKKSKIVDRTSVTSKKAAMRPASDIIERILWDDSIPASCIVVGYEDRFLGILERPFTAFNWADFASLSHTETAIPQHRVVYFKYRSEIVWDKRCRLDNVFGSTTGEKRIHDVIMAYDELHGQPLAGAGDVALADVASVSIPPPYAGDRPNFFVCIRCDSSPIQLAAQEVQGLVCGMEPRLRDSCIPLTALHITLATLRLDSPAHIETARHVLEACQEDLTALFPQQLAVAVQGLECFRGRVLVALVEPSGQKLLASLSQLLMTKFRAAGLATPGNHSEFTAHMTLVKLSRQQCRVIAQIGPETYASAMQRGFGRQAVEELHLCHMTSAKGPDGFYLREHRLLNAPFAEPVCDILSRPPFSLDTPLAVILRGLPGSGKSSVVRDLQSSTEGNKQMVVCSADHFFQKPDSDGSLKYEFNSTLLGEAHQACLAAFCAHVAAGVPLVVLDNTNSKLWEYQAYVAAARTAGYSVVVLEMACASSAQQLVFHARNTHGVPLATHTAMRARWEPDASALFVQPWNVPPTAHGSSAAPMVSMTMAQRVLPLSAASRGGPKFVGLFLTPASRMALLTAFPAVHGHVLAEHITTIYEPSLLCIGALPLGAAVDVLVVSYVIDARGQAVKVAICSSNPDVQSLNRIPHVTISTAVGVAAAYSNELLATTCPVDLEAPLILNTVLGVAMHSGKRIFTTDQLHTQMHDQLQLALQPMLSSKDSDTKAIFVFDFDQTLVNTLGAKEGIARFERITGSKWPADKSWLTAPESLDPTMLLEAGPVLPIFHSYHQRAASHTVILSGRVAGLEKAIQSALQLFGINVAHIMLKPSAQSDTVSFKLDAIRSLMARFPNATSVRVWDDDAENCRALSLFAQQLAPLGMHVSLTVINALEIGEKFHAQTVAHPEKTVQNFLLRHGRLRSNSFSSAACDGIQFLYNSWHAALAQQGATLPVLSSHLALTFGSFNLARMGDVDVVLLAPATFSAWASIRCMEEALVQRGVGYTYAAMTARCPRLRVRLYFERHGCVEYDIVFASVATDALQALPSSTEERVVFAVQRVGSDDKQSRIALDGCERLVGVKRALADHGVAVAVLGLTVEIIKMWFTHHALMGSVCSCIRTFHVVELAMKTLLCTTLTAGAAVSAEEWVAAFFSKMAHQTQAEWEGLLGVPVAPFWTRLQLAITSAVAVLAAAGGSLHSRNVWGEIFSPVPATAASGVADGALLTIVALTPSNAVLGWRLNLFLTARLPSYVSHLAQVGLVASPAPPTQLTEDGTSFAVYVCANKGPVSLETITEVLRQLWGELSVYRQLGAAITVAANGGIVLFSDAPGVNSLAEKLAADSAAAHLTRLDDYAARRVEGLDAGTELVFQSLSSTQRWAVHQRAEELGLLHESKGTGIGRNLIVRFK